MCLLFHSQCQKMEDDHQDMGGEGNQDHPQGNTIGTYKIHAGILPSLGGRVVTLKEIPL